MIEAVNSVLANASLLRGNAEQLNVVRNAEQAQAASAEKQISVDVPRAPYISPRVYVDSDYNKAVLQILDSETGDVLKQFPTEKTLASRAVEAESKALLRGEDDFVFASSDDVERAERQSQASSYFTSSVQVQVEQAQTSAGNGIQPSSGVAEAQIASAALANGAQAAGSAVAAVNFTA